VDPVESWNRDLAGWDVPQELLADGAEPSHRFDAGLCNRQTDEGMGTETPSRRRAREALPDGGTVLDVGCGAGAASLSLARTAATVRLPGAPAAVRVVGVDRQEDMLAAFAGRAERVGLPHAEIHGGWPDVASAAPVADVVVCHHVLYYVGSLAPFVLALTGHASRRVVVEMPAEHPMAWLRPLWQRLHGLERPTRPTLDDALGALRQLGLSVELERWSTPSSWRHDDDQFIGHIRRRLCLPAHREGEVRELLLGLGLPSGDRQMATLWWSPPRAASAT